MINDDLLLVNSYFLPDPQITRKSLLLAVETGLCLVSLSTAAWGQIPQVEENSAKPTDEPPDQAVPDTTAAAVTAPDTASIRPEHQPTAEFSPRSPFGGNPIPHQSIDQVTALPQGGSFNARRPATSRPSRSVQASVSDSRPASPVKIASQSESANHLSIKPEVSTRASDLMQPQAEPSLHPQFSMSGDQALQETRRSSSPRASVANASTSRTSADVFEVADGVILPERSGEDAQIGNGVGSPQAAVSLAPKFSALAKRQTERGAIVPNPSSTHSHASSAPARDPVNQASADAEAVSQREINEYLTEPTAIEPGVLNPLATSIPVDGTLVRYDQEGDVSVGASFGEDRSANFRFDGTFTLDRNLESLTTAGNITVLNQYQTILRGQDVLRERELSISRRDPVTVLGQNIQVTLLADCVDAPNEICTYTPGLVTDRDRVDPDTLLPTQIDQTSRFGDVVTPASLAAIQAPGFQRGTDGQAVGIDLYFPNTTTTPGNTLSDSGTALRHEELETMPAIAYSEIFQTVVSNANEAALARTIRGPAIVFDTEQPITNLVLAAASMLLPEVRPFVPETSDPSNPNISQGLFFAANNTRIPTNSLTLYQAGVGYSVTPPPGTDSELPTANFNAVWLGLSPVTERNYSAATTFENVSDPRVILAAGGEGGGLDAPEVVSFTNGEPFSNTALANVYTQNYFTLFEQDADRVDTFVQNDRIRYYPHLSFTGNITGPADILRYYVGTIAGETIQAYGGVNYQGQTADGWSYRAGAIGYINPNYDRYSNLSAGVSRRLDLGDREALTLGTSFNWALDQDTSLEDIEQTGQGSDITLQARLDLGEVSLGASQIIGDVLPNSQESRTVFDTAVKLGEDVTVAAFWAPFDNATSAPRYGVLADVGFRVGGVEPHLVFSWQNTQYEYGEDLLGNELATNSDTFEILLKLDW